MLRCAVGSETLAVRAQGQTRVKPKDTVFLQWRESAAHYFDAQGNRIS